MAYASLHNIDRPTPGETVVVAAASGVVGAVVSHIAKTQGGTRCRNCREARLFTSIGSGCPDGIDIYFEKVGGAVWDAVLSGKLVVQGVGRAVERSQMPSELFANAIVFLLSGLKLGTIGDRPCI